MNLTMSLFFPPEFHPWLARAGSVEWAKIVHCDDGFRLKGDWSVLVGAGVPRLVCDSLWKMSSTGYMGATDNDCTTLILSVRAGGVALAGGPKIFYPTDEQFESMEEVDLNIPLENYRQPYPVLVVAVPDVCRRRLAVRFGRPLGEVPHAVLLHHDDGGRIFIWMKLGPGPQVPDFTYFFHSHGKFAGRSFEDVLRMRGTGQIEEFQSNFCDPAVAGEFSVGDRLSRAALNCALMLAHFGHRLGGPADPIAWKKHRKLPSLQKFCHGDFTTVQMQQQITIRKEAVRKSEPGEPTGREVKPHWRRGHWRNQHYGLKNVEIKLVFIHPVLVRPDRVSGDLSQSAAHYRG